jgi:hypothetical protein
MRIIIHKILLIALVVFIKQSMVFAHQGHAVISSQTAVTVANKTVKQLTFKDLGFELGKLDVSWKSLTVENFRVLKVLDKTFIISATNAINEEVIYFEIAKNGKVLGVKDTN